MEIANVHTIMLMQQDDNDTEWEMSENESEDPGECTLSSNIDDHQLHNHQEVLHPDQACHDTTIQTIRFHCQQHRAMLILSVYALYFQICDIQLGP